MTERTQRSRGSTKCSSKRSIEKASTGTRSPTARGGVDGGSEIDATISRTDTRPRGQDDLRELLVNGCEQGTASHIALAVAEVTTIHGFMSDIDLKMLDRRVLGEECVESSEALYSRHLRLWLDRDPILTKSEVRSTGGGLHVILRLNEPIICGPGEAVLWDGVVRGIRNALPGDPNCVGVIAATRPIGAINSKYDPPREVRLLRTGELITRDEVLDLNRRVTEQPARLWMRLFFGGERVSPCPFCGKESLGTAGCWQLRCYACGRMDAAALLYRFYAPEFLKKCMEAQHG